MLTNVYFAYLSLTSLHVNKIEKKKKKKKIDRNASLILFRLFF